MIVRCSACATRYLLDPAALGESGRRVRCTRCGHLWHEPPPADEDAAPDRSGPGAPPAPQARPPGWLGWAAAGAFVVAALAGLALARNTIVDSWPSMVRSYDAVGLPIQTPHAQGLRVTDVESERVNDGDRTVLLVRGVVENTTGHSRRVPALRAVLADEGDAALLRWPVAVASSVLDSGQSTTFDSWLENPPEGATRLSVEFVARGGG